MRNSLVDVSAHSSTAYCDIVKVGSYSIANIYKPPSERWDPTNLLPTLPHPAIYVGDFNSHHTDWRYDNTDTEGENLVEWSSRSECALVHDRKQRGTFRSARWQRH